jgi:hypothetical protein
MPDSPPPEDGPDGFEPIAIVWSLPEAAVLTATLSAYGFTPMRRNQGHISVVPALVLALGGIAVCLPREEVADAVALLAEIDCGWCCPPPALARDPWLNGAVLLGMLFFWGLPPMPRIPGLYRWRRARLSDPPPAAAEA